MAIQRYNRYQYETSPRKLEPEYRIKDKKYPKKSSTTKVNSEKQKKSKSQIASMKKQRVKLVFILALVFIAIFIISYRNSKIDESFSKNEELKQAYLEIEKENDQMKVDIENSLNLSNVEQQAKEMLGMQTLTSKQTIYINLPKKDYIQSATESVNSLNDNQNIIQKAINKIKEIF